MALRLYIKHRHYWDLYEQHHALAVSYAERISSLAAPAPPEPLRPTGVVRPPNPAPGAFNAFVDPDPRAGGRFSRRRVRQQAEDNTLLTKVSCTGHCALCISDITIGTTVRTLPCTHTYHTHCFDRLISSSLTYWVQCPLCRIHLHPGNDFEAVARRTVEYTRRAAEATPPTRDPPARGVPTGHTVSASLFQAVHHEHWQLHREAAAAADAAALAFSKSLRAMEQLRRMIRTHRHSLRHLHVGPAQQPLPVD